MATNRRSVAELLRGVTVFLASSLLACSADRATGSKSLVGLYELTSVNGSALPFRSPPSAGGPRFEILGGELLLRADRTFLSATGGTVLAASLLSGTYTSAVGTIALTAQTVPPGTETVELAAKFAGDSVVFEAAANAPMRWAYRRTVHPTPTIKSGAYVLTALNGRKTPLITGEQTLPSGDRAVSYVDFDSLSFVDGVFFTRQRRTFTMWYRPSGESAVRAENFWRSFGRYRAGPSHLLLTYYLTPNAPVPSRDSLVVRGNVLLRRTALVTDTLVEEYTKG